MLCAKFAAKCVKNENTKHMFQKKQKNHKMKLRKNEKFKITNAKTARMAISAIPNMQRHINAKHLRHM